MKLCWIGGSNGYIVNGWRGMNKQKMEPCKNNKTLVLWSPTAIRQPSEQSEYYDKSTVSGKRGQTAGGIAEI